MNISIFVTNWMTAMSSVALTDHFLGEPLSYLESNSHVGAVEVYTPITGEAPKTPRKDEVPAPALIIEIQLKSAEHATALAEADNFKKLFVTKTGKLEEAAKINLEILEVVHFGIPGHESPPPRTAPFSFVVRYYGPVENAADFTDYYVNTHPPLLAQFPKIRNVICHLPLGWRDRGELTDGTLIHGNEAVFDNFEDFKASATSDAMQAVGANAAKFKSFGYTSHHPMQRKRVYARR